MSEKLNTFLLDPNVQLAMDWGKSRNIFDILQPDEIRHSRMLSWLLNPREGHLLCDYFLKTLLREVFKNKGSVDNTFFRNWEPADIEGYSFNSAIVFTELLIGNDSKRRIDVVVLDPINKVAIFIENKTGSGEGCNQTLEYFGKLNERYKDFDQVFVFMDMFEESAKDERHWVNVGYSWLMDSIEQLLERDILSTEIEFILRQYYESISESWKANAYFKKPYDLLSTVAKEHKSFIADLKKVSRSFEIKNLADLENNTLACFYKSNEGFIDSLLEFSGFEYWVEKASRDLSIELESEYKKDGFYIHADVWGKLYIEEYQYWGIQFSIKLHKTPDEKKKDPIAYDITVKVYPKAFENIAEAEKLAKKMQARLQRKGRDFIYIGLKKAISEDRLEEGIKEHVRIVDEFLNKYRKRL